MKLRFTFREILVGALVVGLLVGGTACGTSLSPSSDTELSGTWSGTFTDAISGQGTLRMVMTQSGISVSGNWESTYTNAAKNQTGTLTGTITGSQVSIVMKPASASVCQGNIIATIAKDGKSFAGSYAAINCANTDTGNVSETKQ